MSCTSSLSQVLIEEIWFWLHREMAPAGIHNKWQNRSAKIHHFATLVCLFVETLLKFEEVFHLKIVFFICISLSFFIIWFDRSPCNRGGIKYLHYSHEQKHHGLVSDSGCFLQPHGCSLPERLKWWGFADCPNQVDWDSCEVTYLLILLLILFNYRYSVC